MIFFLGFLLMTPNLTENRFDEKLTSIGIKICLERKRFRNNPKNFDMEKTSPFRNSLYVNKSLKRHMPP